MYSLFLFFFKQKTAYEMRISDWSSDVCSSDLENFERTFSANPMKQMGGYSKRYVGLQIKSHIENPYGYRIEEIYYENDHLIKEKTYKIGRASCRERVCKYV